jgi:hypothetical protein
MAELNVPAGFGLVEWRFNSGDSTGSSPMITWGVEFDGSSTLNTIAHDLYDAFVSAGMWSEASHFWQLTGCYVKEGPLVSGLSALYTETTDGGEGNPPVPSQVAVVFQKVTGMGGRAGRGRFFLPGLTYVRTQNGYTVNAGTMPLLITAAASLLTNVAAVDGVIGSVLFHEGSGAPTEILELIPQADLATIRRRARK